MIKLTVNPKKLWFTSDSHYGHKNICRGVSQWGSNDASGNFVVNEAATRDFANLKEMNDALVDRINSTVGTDDILVHGGDWSFGGQEKIKEFRDRIKCKNIILIYGNHDSNIRANRFGEHKLFKHLSDYEEIKINGEHSLVVFHYPIESWNGMHHGSIMLQGHRHLKGDLIYSPGKRMDIGACGNDLYPYSLEEILAIMKDRNFVQVPNDHHA